MGALVLGLFFFRVPNPNGHFSKYWLLIFASIFVWDIALMVIMMVNYLWMQTLLKINFNLIFFNSLSINNYFRLEHQAPPQKWNTPKKKINTFFTRLHFGIFL